MNASRQIRHVYSLVHAPMLGLTYGNRYKVVECAAPLYRTDDTAIVTDDDGEGHVLGPGKWQTRKPRTKAS